MINKAIENKYGFKAGLDISGDKITKWPYEVAKPTKAKLETIVTEYKALNLPRPKRQHEIIADLEARIVILEAL